MRLFLSTKSFRSFPPSFLFACEFLLSLLICAKSSEARIGPLISYPLILQSCDISCFFAIGSLLKQLSRKKKHKLTWMVLFQALLCILFGGSLGQNLYLKSMAMISATFASASTILFLH